ncbi:hypothetical protein M378DRAFT_76121 [Amanita muscaria Koide BX008]|uniref:cAMP-independent regulatory protein pac2 n=1 Tax=Amanita muscaria (strain Koide BX008) TaxID=946122 RepID=A0A0C2X993_AMAMK|nr:hypothetical protein M378DRAFT_76121 [Amanita muscaria Koide BX008]
MQRATCTGLRIRSPADARTIFHAVRTGILPMVTRRLDTEERSLISPGSVYVWEERGPHAELTGVGIERWTDGIRWGPSRVREGFLFYHEKQSPQHMYPEYDMAGSSRPSSSLAHDASRLSLIKQTYTVFVDTTKGQRKWHLIAYFTEESIERLKCIDDVPQLASLQVPHGKYKSARSVKGRPDHIFNPESEGPEYAHLEYVPYTPRVGHSHSPRERMWHKAGSHEVPYLESRRYPFWGGSDSSAPEGGVPAALAPLAYLENIPPPRRHPLDEKALKLLSPAGIL